MLKQLMESNQELDRLVDHWKPKCPDMTDAELRSAIGTDLEMLEYSPAEAADALLQVMKQLCR